MTRLIAILGCAFALTLATPMGFKAEAAKKPNKLCKATALDGKPTKWKCKGSDKCCYDWLANKGTCAAPAPCL